MTPAETANLTENIQRRLDSALQARGYAFSMRVLPEQCRRDERWTYVSIAPGQETFNPNEYVRVLRDVEYDMWDDGQESVMLVPARAD